MKAISKCYDFDDVLLTPTISRVNSRREVDLSVRLSDTLKLEIPILSSPMKGISSPELVVALGELGGLGILHRFVEDDMELERQLVWISKHTEKFGMAIGLNDDRYKLGMDFGCKIFCIDVANGYTQGVVKFVSEVVGFLNERDYDGLVMAGNVATLDGAIELAHAGAKLIRVGIGNGNLCTTRNVTGVGVPQISALMDCRLTPYAGVSIVADGGIKNSGDAVKALAAGGDVVMLGSLFGHCQESSHNGIIYGMASRKLQEEYYHNTKSVEGIEQACEKTTTIREFLDEFLWGMRSAFTYLDSYNIGGLKQNAQFVEIGRSSLKQL